jgi:hypothetical protein
MLNPSFAAFNDRVSTRQILRLQVNPFGDDQRTEPCAQGRDCGKIAT